MNKYSESNNPTETLAYKNIVMPEHLNAQQTLFGGTLLSWIDLAGAVEAVSHTRQRVVLASIKDCRFLTPIFAGTIIEIYTHVVKTGRTSITIQADVWATEKMGAGNEKILAASASAVYVAINKNRKPTALQNNHT